MQSWGRIGSVLVRLGHRLVFMWANKLLFRPQMAPKSSPNHPKSTQAVPNRVRICDEIMPNTSQTTVKHQPNHAANYLSVCLSVCLSVWCSFPDTAAYTLCQETETTH